MMREPTIARNYAETLLALAQKAGDLTGWGEMIDSRRRRDGNRSPPARVSRVAARQRAKKNEIFQKAYGDQLPRNFVRFHSGAGLPPPADDDSRRSRTNTTISSIRSKAACTPR